MKLIIFIALLLEQLQKVTDGKVKVLKKWKK